MGGGQKRWTAGSDSLLNGKGRKLQFQKILCRRQIATNFDHSEDNFCSECLDG